MTRRRAARPGVPLGVLATWAVVPAIVFAGVWQYADANVPPPTTTTTTTLPPPPSDELVTPLLSLRRHPTPIAERVAADASRAAYDARVVELTEGIGDGSCLRMAAVSEELAVVADDVQVIPASNQKLLVAAVALDVLGADAVFRTELQSAAPFFGVIPGDVYLVGGGDPVLVTAGVPDPLRFPAFNTTALEPLADQLVTLGVTRIDGDIVGDGSRYDDEFRAPTWGPEITNVDAGPYDALLVNDGQLAPGTYGLDPNRSAARTFLDLVAARGITVAGSAANGPRPADAELTTLALVESLPLTEILVELLHTSDNNTAEMLVKEIGFVAAGQGTRQAGLDTIRATLERWQVPTAGLELHDGSGLSRENRLTCATLTALFQSPVANALRDLLPVAGRDGTLADQLVGSEAEGRMVAKTGTLTDVKALAGSMPAADRTPVDFSLVLNGPDVDDAAVYAPLWERLAQLIGEYPIVVEPDVEAVAPR